jgi:hypothetical protein
MLQSMGGNAESSQPVVATKDLNLLKDLKRKMDELESGGIGGEQLSDVLIRVNKLET